MVISHGKELSVHGSAEGLGLDCAKVGDEGLDMLLEVLLAGDVGAAQELAREDAEPGLDRIDPGCVFGREMKNDRVPAIAEELRA